MDRQQFVRVTGGALVPLGALLVGLSAILARPAGIGLGGFAAITGGIVYWTVDSWWRHLEQWTDPDIDFGRRNTLFRGLFRLGITVAEFGVVLGGFLWFGTPISVSPAGILPTIAVIAGGVGLGAGLLVVVAQINGVRQRSGTRLGDQITFMLPVVVFALLLLFLSSTSIIFAATYIGSRLVTLPAIYLIMR